MALATAAQQHKEELDPITLSVVWNRLLALTYECGERLHLAAQSWVMGAARDLGCVLMTPEMEIATQVEFLPCHTLGSELPATVMLSWHPNLGPGDMILANDGHIIKAGHMPDWSTLSPIFYKGEIVFYVYLRGHQADTGGAFSGGYFPRAYDCISEGLNIPPIKIMKQGKPNEEVRQLLFNNIRTREAVWADLMVMYGSAIKMEEGVGELIDKYGLETIKASVAEMMRRDEIATRDQIRAMPDGVYYGECACDWDGSVPNKQVWVRVQMTVNGDELTFDWSDSDDQVDFINSPLGNTYTYTYFGLFLTLDSGIPHNHGSMRAVKIVAPEGKCVNPKRPATYGGCGCSLGQEITQATLKALAKAVPDKVMGNPSWQFEADITGRLPIIDPRSGQEQEYFANPFIAEGGTGAVKGYDGWDGECGVGGMGALKRGSVEESELYLPIRYAIVKTAPDSEGPGEFTGARGTYSERICLIPPGRKMQIQAGNCSGATYPPYGAAGAPPARVGAMHILRNRKKKKDIFRTVDVDYCYFGDKMMVTAMGGGGWGDPFKRDPEKVRKAVMNGYLTVEKAKSVYGVAVTQTDKSNPETIEINSKLTQKLRKRLPGLPIYRHIDMVRDDVRSGRISVHSAREKYGVVFQPNYGEIKRILVDYIGTQELRYKMMRRAANNIL
jgi:N-methylhydantoinase B